AIGQMAGLQLGSVSPRGYIGDVTTIASIFPLAGALNEPYATGVFCAMLGVLIAIAVVVTKPLDRIGVPVVLLFLALGIVGGSEGIGGSILTARSRSCSSCSTAG
ncbi:MAG TPA: hypothetical protein PKB10_14415, partial [Tepidisphaeraceae bacterium]|nr:hypothetical protein [Tepidisphaeraceae bacterium]